jgi:type IV secretion system protein VirB9
MSVLTKNENHDDASDGGLNIKDYVLVDLSTRFVIGFFVCAMLLVGVAKEVNAEMIPSKGRYDARVRVVNYNPEDVVNIKTYFGVSTHIKFGEGEEITHVAAGDSLAWKIVPAENHLFIKPQAEQGDTNITVVTNKRDYQFVVTVAKHDEKDLKAWTDKNLIYSLAFKYPEEERLAKVRAIEVEAEQREEAKVNDISLGARYSRNLNYLVRGDASVSPTKAWDDGQFTFLTFGNNADLPAVYEEDMATGDESLINTNVKDGNTIVVHKIVKNVILRKGKKVAGVFNSYFDYMNFNENKTGTASNTVKRVLKTDEAKK